MEGRVPRPRQHIVRFRKHLEQRAVLRRPPGVACTSCSPSCTRLSWSVSGCRAAKSPTRHFMLCCSGSRLSLGIALSSPLPSFPNVARILSDSCSQHMLVRRMSQDHCLRCWSAGRLDKQCRDDKAARILREESLSGLQIAEIGVSGSWAALRA